MTQPAWISSPVEDSADMGRRRSQRKGYLFERSGAWILRWREDLADGSRIQKSTVIARSKGPDAISKRQAQKLAWDTVLSKLEAFSLKPGSSLSLAQFVKLRFEPDRIENMKYSGKEHYRYVLNNHVLPYLGNFRMKDITTASILDLMRTKKDYSSQTKLHIKHALSAVLGHARECEMFAGRLPTDGVKLPKFESKERIALTGEQAQSVIAALPGQYSILAALLGTTGLRIGEAAGLRWKRLDVERGTITVIEAFSKGRWCSTKSQRSIRVVPVPERVLNAMLSLRARGHHLDQEDTVFVTSHGNPIGSHTAASKILKPVVRSLGLPWVCWHSFRHTNASLSDRNGMTVAELQKTLGHGSGVMSMRYTHTEVENVRGKLEKVALEMLPPILGYSSAHDQEIKVG